MAGTSSIIDATAPSRHALVQIGMPAAAASRQLLGDTLPPDLPDWGEPHIFSFTAFFFLTAFFFSGRALNRLCFFGGGILIWVCQRDVMTKVTKSSRKQDKRSASNNFRVREERQMVFVVSP